MVMIDQVTGHGLFQPSPLSLEAIRSGTRKFQPADHMVLLAASLRPWVRSKSHLH